jgi:hypothetical protein
MYNNIIVHNKAIRGYGGGISFGSELINDASVVNNTIAYNEAGIKGGGITVSRCPTGILRNSIVWGNSAPVNSQIHTEGGSTLEVSYSDIQGGWIGEGNIDADPLFDHDTLLCHFPENSPCVDAGNPSETYNDLENPSVSGSPLWPAHGTLRNDLGAYGGPTPFLVDTASGLTDVKNRFEQYKVVNTIQLHQNYPNPFNPSTTINYALPKPEHVTITVYNTLGQEIETLVDKYMPIGHHQVEFNGQNLPSGVYFYRLEAGDLIQTRKMLLVK